MQGPAEETDVCRVNWLLLEEVVRHKLDIKIFQFLGIRDNLRQFLDDQAQVRIFAS
jgi:hypothetical protein